MFVIQALLATHIVLLSPKVFAAQTITEQAFNIEKGESIEINGFSGNVNLVGSEVLTNQAIKIKIVNVIPQTEVRGPSSVKAYPRLVAKKSGKGIDVSFDQDFSVEDWAHFLTSQDWPVSHIEISGVSRPIDINWQSGQIRVNQWNEKVSADAPKAQINVSGGEGDADLSTLSGSIVVKNRKGIVKVVSHEGSQILDGVTGPMSVENFAGDFKIENSSGELSLMSYSGKSQVVKHAGAIEFDSQKAQMTFQGLQDPLRGSNDSGEIMIDSDGASSINIKSKEGLVSLKAPRSGAFVVASSLEGFVNVPGHFEAYRGPDNIQRSGRLRGEQPGRFVIRSEKGQVRVQ